MTPIPVLSAEDFLGKFLTEMRPALKKALERYTDCHGLVLYENLAMDASEFGAVAALVCGPSNSLKSVDDAKNTPIGDVPSRFKYPVGFCSRPALLKALEGK
jgi:hypothetical protein